MNLICPIPITTAQNKNTSKYLQRGLIGAQAYLCVHVLWLTGVLYPIRKLRRPAWAIIIPLSMQNLYYFWAKWHKKRQSCRPFIRGKDCSPALSGHNSHHLLETLVTFRIEIKERKKPRNRETSSHPTPPTISTSLLPIWAIARSVISTSMAKMVSWSEKQRSAGVKISWSPGDLGFPSGRKRLSRVKASIDVRIPDRLTSIPFVV